MPIKLTTASKSNFVSRPSVPSSQKQSATEFNELVEAVNSNYERVIFDWNLDIIANRLLKVGNFVLYTGNLWRIDTEYNVGSPKTFVEGNGTNLTSGAVVTENYTTQRVGTASLTLSTHEINIYTGAGTTWTLPPVAGNENKKRTVKNIGAGTLTLQGTGATDIRTGLGEVASIAIGPNEVYTFTNDGTNWNQI